MKKPDDNKLDRLFREGLNEPDGNAAFREDDWEAMERLLDEKPRKNRGIIWLYWLSGSIAAMLVLFFGRELLKPAALVKNNITKVSVHKKASTENSKNKVDSGAKEIKILSDQKIKSTEVANNEKKIYTDRNSIRQSNHAKTTNDKTLLSSDNQSGKINSKNHTTPVPDRKQNNIGTNNLAVNEALLAQKQTMISADNQANAASRFYADKRSIDLKSTELTASEAETIFTDSTPRLAVIPKAIDLLANQKAITKAKIPAKTKQNMPPRFSLAILSAPDLNGVNSFTGTKVGTNAGLQFSVQLTRKFSINTGAVYAAKPYEIDMAQYKTAATYWGKPGDVAVDCKVLDFPINLNYQVFSKHQNSFSAGAGLSSYFMLRENYNFYYTDNTSYSHKVVNQNKHILGVLNFNASYQRQVNPNFNLIVQPYLKLPLTPIGYERINLQSAGVAVGVGWNIHSRKNR